jgi:hypothetical protein
MNDYKPPTGISPYPQRINIQEGVCKGEVCNRDGCTGIIDEHEKEGCCSCHINPPCSYCTTDTAFCPKCDWEASDVELPTISKEQQERYRLQNEQWDKRRDSFFKKYRGDEPATKLEMRTESHTHFSQKVLGVFPEGTETTSTILPRVIGSFGGRFEHFDKYSFEYIAYTD